MGDFHNFQIDWRDRERRELPRNDFSGYQLHEFAGRDTSSDTGSFTILAIASNDEQAMRHVRRHLVQIGRRDLLPVVQHRGSDDLPMPGVLWSNVEDGTDED